MKKRYIILLLIIFSAIIIASSIPFRFYPTHKIVKQVNCFSCHVSELEDLKAGNHIKMMDRSQNKTLYDYLYLYGSNNTVESLEGPCFSCHITYANYQLFGLTDPYAYTIGNYEYAMGDLTYNVDLLDAQYGEIIEWPAGNNSVAYFGGNVSVTIELEALSVSPSNFSVDSTIKFSLSNYSGQQNGNTSCDCSGTLYEGDTHVLKVENIYNDYYKIILILDGLWNSTTLNLRIYNTDQGNKSYIITADTHPFIYELPYSDNGTYYFKTNGTYKAVRLDYVMGEWVNYTIRNIATSEIIEVSSNNEWKSANTCSSQDVMCHINQKATSMGLNDGLNTSKSFYSHQMEYTTSRQCELCHLKNRLIVNIR